MRKIVSISLLFFLFLSVVAKAQSFPDSVKTSKDMNAFLLQYSKATTTVDSTWLKTNLSDSFQYSDPLNYNINKIDYIAMYVKGVYKISKSNATIDKISRKANAFTVLVHSDIEGNAGGTPVSGTYPFTFIIQNKSGKYLIRSLEVSQ